jgi:hypothetical protein
VIVYQQAERDFSASDRVQFTAPYHDKDEQRMGAGWADYFADRFLGYTMKFGRNF